MQPNPSVEITYKFTNEYGVDVILLTRTSQTDGEATIDMSLSNNDSEVARFGTCITYMEAAKVIEALAYVLAKAAIQA